MPNVFCMIPLMIEILFKGCWCLFSGSTIQKNPKREWMPPLAKQNPPLAKRNIIEVYDQFTFQEKIFRE